MNRVVGIVTVLALATVCSGCSGPWGKFYQPTSSGAENFPPTARAQVRYVPIERVNNYLHEMNDNVVNSNQSVYEMDEAGRNAVRSQVLEMLQLPERADTAKVLGFSVFVLPARHAIDPQNGQLERFARSIGADYAIWSSGDAGTADRINMVPVTSNSIYSNGFGSVTGTTFGAAPVVTSERQIEYIAFFVRKN